MMAAKSIFGLIAPTVVTTVVSSGLAIAINYATDGRTWWLWVVVVTLTLAMIGATLWMNHRQGAGSRTSPDITKDVESQQMQGLTIRLGGEGGRNGGAGGGGGVIGSGTGGRGGDGCGPVKQ